MKRRASFLAFVAAALLSVSAFAQRTVSGTVTDAASGDGLPSVSVRVKGTNSSAVTNYDGKYSITAGQNAVLVFSALGYATQEVTATGAVVNVKLAESTSKLDEVVVTALGVTRDKKSLGFAVQEVSGAEVSSVKDPNFMASLSGKVAGVQIRQSGTMGGSANVVVRGYKSLTGNNQALFVVDGIPISNNVDNTSNQQTGRGGYDYGNAAMDINPDDIASISVLKGAAATALYGSRASNGVIMITTKKGASRKGLGVTVSTGLTVGKINKNTYTKYQKEYGQGYGQFYGPNGDSYFDSTDIDGDNILDGYLPTYEDASFGAKFDPSLMVYDWEGVYGDLTNGGAKMPYVAGKHDPTYFFKTALTKNNTVAVEGGTDISTFRVSATQMDQNGITPNSRLTRNNFNLNATVKPTNRLTVSAVANFVNQAGKGRMGTGYSGQNPNQSFKQWYNVGVDVAKLEEYYMKTGQNITWNAKGYGYGPIGSYEAGRPMYTDNAYFTAYESYNNDSRNRFIGNTAVQYQVNDWLDIFGRMSVDTYNSLQEERLAVGSIDVPYYVRRDRTFTESNFDLFANFNKDLNTNLNLSGSVGYNSRRTYQDYIGMSTNGGLVVPGVYALSNSVSTPNAPTEARSTVGVEGFFGRASLGYKKYLFLEGAGRYDVSSTLPAGKNGYFYPSVSGSFIFSELMANDFVSFGKARLNYAEVGNGAPAQSLYNTYVMGTAWDGISTASAPSQSNNPNLLPEQTRSSEAGLEMMFKDNRFGFDVSYYNATSFNQIMPARVSSATGTITKFVNAGTIRNRGIELSLNFNPIRTKNFNWNSTLNLTRNRNKVLSLFDGAESLQLGSVQGGVAIEARVGEAYGTIFGTQAAIDSVSGLPIVYDLSTHGVRYWKGPGNVWSKGVIGNINPDFIGGWNNQFKYKNVSLSFLIDFQKGGSLFSLDTYYGYATGLYDWSAGLNDKGGEVRGDPGTVTADGMSGDGGYRMPQVAYWNGTYNDDGSMHLEVRDDLYGNVMNYANSFGYARTANQHHIYDASFVKLRELNLTYSLPSSKLTGAIKGLDLSLTGRNLLILYKNVPYADPEAGLSAGNVQGNQSGAYPSVREVGVNVRLKF
jgi:TonB-linked SusC/RagA family outer membrane protein